jgi:hypothetical protein
LKSPTTEAALASFASTENVTLQTGFVFINCFFIDITISFLELWGKENNFCRTSNIRDEVLTV